MGDRSNRALVLGASGFIGTHLCADLSRRGYFIRGVDREVPQFLKSPADEFIIGDLRDTDFVETIFDDEFDEVYQLAANMGGAGFISTGDNDAQIVHDSALINLNCVEACHQFRAKKVFFSSSACVYPEYNQRSSESINCSEDSAYPAAPESEYGWEKLFSERLYLSYRRNFGLNVRIARLHNSYGEYSTWKGGREKAPAALCRKVTMAEAGGNVEIWGDGEQTRSFLYIEDCLEGIRRLMNSNISGPVNIGSTERVTIKALAELIIRLSEKSLTLKFTSGPQGVRARTSDNNLANQFLGWFPRFSLEQGINRLYRWVENQVVAENAFLAPTHLKTVDRPFAGVGQ